MQTPPTLCELVNDLWHGSHSQLADAAGMARNTLRRVLRCDYVSVPLDNLQKLSAAMTPRLARYNAQDAVALDALLAAYLRQQAAGLDKS